MHKINKTQKKERHPNFNLEFNTLVVKFNKHLVEKASVAEGDVKQLARNFKTLATRVEQMIKEIKQEEDASPHGILNHHNN